MKLTFKLYLQEASQNQALEIAAQFLETQINKLKVVTGDLEDQVLETGKEIKNKLVKMVHGNLVIRLFKALGKMFVRVEYPDKELKLYTIADPA